VYKKAVFFTFLLFTGAIILFFSGCANQDKKLIVFAGKGLKVAVEDIVHSFEQKYRVNVNVVYGGSQTLLTVIQKTHKGDIFIPGRLQYIEQADDLVAYYKIIAEHRPAVVVRSDNTKEIFSFQDLTRPGISLAIGNKNTCALGMITEELLERSGKLPDFLKNVVIQAATADELLDLVVNGEVDAAITHAHLLTLPKSKELRRVDIPASFIQPQKIPLGVLRVSENRKIADLFCTFVDTEGSEIFKKHGFGE